MAFSRFAKTLRAAATVAALCAAAPVAVADDAAPFGKPGEPVNLIVGYQPYFTPSWSGVVMKAKGFWKQHLPAGSEVTFELGIQGSVLVGKMMAGKLQIAYLGDMPTIIASTKPEVADIRIVAAVGTSQQQCNLFLVRKDAPDFKSAEDAVKWLDGKIVATPQGSCTDSFARKVFQRLGVKPAKYFNQGADQMAESFKAGKIDGGVLWEPYAARFVEEGVARRVASGVNFNEFDGTFMVMRQDFMAARPDVAKAWLEAELDAELFIADPKNAAEISAILVAEANGFSKKELWTALYGDYPSAIGGSPDRLALDFVLTPRIRTQLDAANAFLFGLKRVPGPTLRQEAVADGIAREVLEARGSKSPVGIVKSLPDTSFTQ